MNRKEFAQKFLDLNLPIDEYMLFGSGSMFLHGIDRIPNDIDILVTENLYNKLKTDNKFKEINKPDHGSLELDNIEIFYNFVLSGEKKTFMDFSAFLVNPYNVMCIDLKDLKNYKSIKAREKDLRDVELIKNFLFKK